MTQDLSQDKAADFIEIKTLKGFFLAASPVMEDERFAESLILMVHHDKTGAAGFVINHPVSNLSFYSLLEQLEIENPGGVSDHLVFCGGPVRPNNGFVIYRGTLGLRDETHVGQNIYYSRSLDSLKRIAEGRGPDDYLICLGRAEWSPGQLEDELKENVWLPSTLNADQVFQTDIDALWSQVLDAQGISTVNFTNVAGHA